MFAQNVWGHGLGHISHLFDTNKKTLSITVSIIRNSQFDHANEAVFDRVFLANAAKNLL